MTSQTREASHINTLLISPSYPIILRTIETSDVVSWATLLADPANGGDGNLIPEERGTELISRQRESASKPTVVDAATNKVLSGPGRVNLVVVDKTETVIGLGGYGAIKDWVHDGENIRAGDVGVLLAPSARGKGYGLEAIRMAVDWGFRPASEGGLQLDLVTITTLEDNETMVRMAEEKLGCMGKRVVRSAEFDEKKQEYYYEITPEDWRQLK